MFWVSFHEEAAAEQQQDGEPGAASGVKGVRKFVYVYMYAGVTPTYAAHTTRVGVLSPGDTWRNGTAGLEVTWHDTRVMSRATVHVSRSAPGEKM